MKEFPFPIFKTKIDEVSRVFSLPSDRTEYFQAKAGTEINKIKSFLKNKTFFAFLLGKKNSGKGTYSKMFMELIGPDLVAHVSVGDIVRNVHHDINDPERKRSLEEYLSKRYRGFIPIEKIWDVILGRDTKTLLPTEVVLALVEREIDAIGRKAIFIDGFPRNLDQISYSLFFKTLMGYRDDPDFFVFIDIPESVIDERIKNRVICPTCHTPRSLKLLRTKEIGYDENKKEFYLICDNAGCDGGRMVAKEGDVLGIEAIRDRIEVDDQVMRMLLTLEGAPKIYLRNAIPLSAAEKNADGYELTPEYQYQWDPNSKTVRVIEIPWKIRDENGEESYSLLPEAVTLSLIKQVCKVLEL